MTLGKYPTMTLKKAKSEHRKALDMLQNDKKDPALEKQKEKTEARDSSTVEGLIEEYLEKHAKPNKRSWEEDQRMLYKDVRPIWGKRKAKDITRRDVIQLLDKIKERGSPIIANRTLACVRRMFNFAIKRALLDASPCIMIEAPAKENRRDRYLSTEEIKIVWHGLDNAPMSDAIKLALKLLLVTAQRKSEVISAEWGEIDFTTNIWTIPAAKAKNGFAHRVPLSKLALELLAEIRKISGDSRWLFPSERTNAPIRGQSVDHALRRSLYAFEGVKNFCVHDCRRTAATHMASLRISGEILSRILNHAKKGVTEQHYIKHGYDDEKRNALELWARKLNELIFNATINNIVSLSA
jgi:integrase